MGISQLAVLQRKEHIPRGRMAVEVGKEGEEKRRFFIPVGYFNHPLFLQLLKVAEDEYGFDQKGTITLPCRVHEFQELQGLIDLEGSLFNLAHRTHLLSCFKP